MRLLDKIHELVPQCQPNNLKIQLMNRNGWTDPHKLFRSGKLLAWQAAQPDPNLNRPFVINLIKLPQKNLWLFAGLSQVLDGPTYGPTGRSYQHRWNYVLKEVDLVAALKGTMKVELTKPATNTYLNGENFYDRITVVNEMK